MIEIMSCDHTRLFSLPLATERRLQPGEALFFAGDPVLQLALITEGRVRLLRRTMDGTDVILQTAVPGDVLAEAWAAHLARSVQAARLRAEIRTLRKVSERVDAWLGEGRALPDKGHWQDLAAELGVTREALYRELARRR